MRPISQLNQAQGICWTHRERLCPDHPLSPPQGTYPENVNVVPLLLGQHLFQGVCIGWAGGPAWNNAHLSDLIS